MVLILELNVLKATLSLSVLMTDNDNFTMKQYIVLTATLLVFIAHKNKSLTLYIL
jgi:hypothetical protein